MVPHLAVPNVTISSVIWSDALSGRLLPEEQELIKPNWAKKRKADFTLGRAAAREALSVHGHPTAAILKGLDDGPIWPSTVVGSIAHSGEIGIAAVASSGHFAGLGIDLELMSGKAQKVLSRIAHEDEIAWIREGDEVCRSCRLFCAKEALYKALAPLCNRYIGFKEAMMLPAKENQLSVSLAPALREDLPSVKDVRIYCADNDTHCLAIACIHY